MFWESKSACLKFINAEMFAVIFIGEYMYFVCHWKTVFNDFVFTSHHVQFKCKFINDLKYRVLTVQNAYKGTSVSLIYKKKSSEISQPKSIFLSLLNKNATWKNCDFQFSNLVTLIGIS